MSKKFKPEPDQGLSPHWIDLDLFLVRVRNARRELEEWRASKNEHVIDVEEEIQRLRDNVSGAESALADYILKNRELIMYAPEFWYLNDIGTSGDYLDVKLPKIKESHEQRQKENAERFNREHRERMNQ